MYENTVDLLCQESERLLKLTTQYLNTQIENSNSEEDNIDYQKIIEILNTELTKVTNRETVIAVVGTMKAGKSTTINAIVGREILPNRNEPMTAIPTLIRHVKGKLEPEINFSHHEPIRRIITKIYEIINDAEIKETACKKIHDAHMDVLLNQLRDLSWLEIPHAGEEGIFEFLKKINDLVRLSKLLDVEFPFDDYRDIEQLPVIEVEFSSLANQDESHGSLALLDTPGPNEADQPHLMKIMRDQLRKSSAVLAVLDYTQLKSDADKQVRDEIGVALNGSGEQLFVLVNKFDQKDKNSADETVIKQTVRQLFKENQLGEDHIYPGSSKHAYLANRALDMIHRNYSHLENEGWIDDFADAAFGVWDHEDLDDHENVLKQAQKLWKKSRFSSLLENVIQSAYQKSALLAAKSAASKLSNHSQSLLGVVEFRFKSLTKDINGLEEHISALNADIEKVNNLQKLLSDKIDHTLLSVNSVVEDILSDSKNQLMQNIDDYFAQGENKNNETATTPFSVTETALSIFREQVRKRKEAKEQHKTQNTPKDSNPVSKKLTFNSENSVLELFNTINSSVNCLLEDCKESINKTLAQKYKSTNNEITDFVNDEIFSILNDINKRLNNDGFDITIAFPQVDELNVEISNEINVANSFNVLKKTDSYSRRQSGLWGSLCSLVNTKEYGWETIETNRFEYVVDFHRVKNELENKVDSYSDNIKKEIGSVFNSKMQEQLSSYVDMFKKKIELMRGALIQSSLDHQHDKSQREVIANYLSGEILKIKNITEDAESLKKDLKGLLND